jgi:hypothetical protein
MFTKFDLGCFDKVGSKMGKYIELNNTKVMYGLLSISAFQ